MRALSPIRATSPFSRPKITFNYPPSPIRERPSYLQSITPNTAQTLTPTLLQSPKSKPQTVYIQPDLCKICSKQANYKEMKQGGKYCSACAITEMRKGLPMVRIQLKEQRFYKKFHQKNQKENNGAYQNRYFCGEDEKVNIGTISSLPPQYQLPCLLKESEILKQDLQSLLSKLQNKQFASDGIKSIYRQKKLGLKNHYEKIKAAIKASIEKDLAQLEKREMHSLECLEEIKMEIGNGVKDIETAKEKLENAEIHSNQKDAKLEALISESASSVIILKEKRRIASQIVSQLSNSNQHVDSLHVRLTNQQLQQTRGQLYEPLTYILFQDKYAKGQTLFSFQGKSK